MIERREFIAGLGSAAAWPVVARAQQGERMRQIGVLSPNAVDNEYKIVTVPFLQGLTESGYVEGQNVAAVSLHAPEDARSGLGWAEDSLPRSHAGGLRGAAKCLAI
jgi:putative ABC transport system substrate-binding protein